MNSTMTIISNSIENDYYNKYYAKNEKRDKFILYFKKEENSMFRIGDKINILGEYSIPDTSRNYGGFNYRYYLNSIETYGTIKVKKYNLISDKTQNIIYILQNNITEKLNKLLSKNQAGILNGMLIGETNGISNEVIEDFKNSGITHLLAVSGSNIVLVIVISKFIFLKIFGKKYSWIFIISFIVFFVCISGASSSVVRAGLMAIFEIFAGLLIKKSNSINNLFLSAFVILLINPLSIINIGFILSFAGTIGILLISDLISQRLKEHIKFEMLLENLSITLSAQIILLPVMAYYFNSISLTSLITNLLVLPISSVLTVTGLILFILSIIYFPLAKLISIPLGYLIDYIMIIAKAYSKLSFFNFIVSTPNIFEIVLYYMIIWMLINRKNSLLKKVLVGIVIFLLVITKVYDIIPKSYVEVSCVDVGQGDCFFIETSKGKRILIDGGGSETSNYDVGKNILLPYLLDKGCKKIDLIFISHAHADHMDGIMTVIEKLKVSKVIIGVQDLNDTKIRALYEICKKRHVEIKTIIAGESLKIDDLIFDILYPAKNIKDDNINNLSLVIKMRYKSRSMLFTGDIETYGEDKIDANIKADILKVAHHGSNTSTSEHFLKKVLPQISIISVAKKNMYGHPNENVVERIKRFSNKLYMTKDSGEINIRIYKNSKIFIKERIKRK